MREVVEGGLVSAGCGAQPGGCGRAGVGELGQAGPEQMVMGVGEQQCLVQAEGRTRAERKLVEVILCVTADLLER